MLELGCAHVAGKYPITTGSHNFLTYGVDVLGDMGFTKCKLYLSPNYSGSLDIDKKDYPNQAWQSSSYTTLVGLAQDPAYQTVFTDTRFDTYFLNTWTFANGINNPWVSSQPSAQLSNEYNEIKNLCVHLLNTYSNKTFIIQNWEGDWALLGAFNPNNAIDNWRAQRMAAFMRERKKAIRDATREVPTATSKIKMAIEVNRVLDDINDRVHTDVAPFVDVDYISLSLYEAINAFVGQSTQGAAEAAIKQKIQEVFDRVRKYNKNIPIYIGEFGFPQKETSMSGFDVTGFLDAIKQKSEELGIVYALWWNLFDNEEQSPGVERGYSLYDRSPFALNDAGTWFDNELPDPPGPVPTEVDALRIETSSERVRIPAGAYPTDPAYWTWCGWGKIDVDRNTYTVFFALETGVGHATEWNELVTETNGTTLSIYDTNGNVATLGSMTVGVWYFMALSQNNGTLTAYIAAEGDTSLTKVSGSGEVISVIETATMGMSTFTAEALNGSMCQGRLWDVVLTDAEVLEEFLSFELVKTSSVLGWWKMDDITNFRLDSSGNSNTLTTLGEGSWTIVDGPTIGV